jgi:hypothetical protein
MTLGGYVPYGEDGLGGLWAADLRSHLSVYGGFFSNVGAVRKQFLGGSLLGIGIYWDYDGDLNQYSDTTITDGSGSYDFAGGQVYNQVGISAEWLTDFGNLRSNGYVPVGQTGQVMGPFVGNSLLCTPGINAALTGTDLEVGAYIPGLNDWAGMISVGGYAYGNSRYDLADGQDSVPWFGGVYTRLDMTFIENWDFSLQYNNDSYFDSTGFARLTYRMGGSRRRNVPDQMEQPMMRNEHIVRAHQAPTQALNPNNIIDGKYQPWRVLHVDNSATDAASGDGTAASPYTTLAQPQATSQPWDIVYVHRGNSANSPYGGQYAFQQSNQYLLGEGSTVSIPTVDCGFLSFASIAGSSGDYPVFSNTNPNEASIALTAANPTVDHVRIVGSAVGISDGGGMPVRSIANVNDVQIVGTGASQVGVVIQDLSDGRGTFNFTNLLVSNLTADGFVVDGQAIGGISPQVNIASSRFENTSGSAIVVNDVIKQDGIGRVRVSDSTIAGTTDAGVRVYGGNATVESVQMTGIGTAGVAVVAKPLVADSESPVTSGISTVQVVNSSIAATIGIQASSNNADDVVNITINQNTLVSQNGGNGINLAVGDGKINTSIIGNSIRAADTTAITTGTAGGITDPVQLASNIYLTTGTSAGINNLSVKAVGLDNLRALNRNATVTTSPQQNPIITGTTPAPVPPPPPPPNYDPALAVPLPPP